MNLAGQVLRFYVPEIARRRALHELFQSSAAAFGARLPPLRGSADELLDRYAMFTAEHAAASLSSGRRIAQIREHLYASAYAIGARLRCDLNLSSSSDVMAAARAVYRMLRIDFRRTADGEVRVGQCYFSRFYSPPICRLMSALDQGLLAGLSRGGRLEFRQRITEGAPFCLAAFTEMSK